MGKHFGNLMKITGINFYYLSPYEQNVFKGMINPGFWNTLRRCRESFLWFTVPLAVWYGVVVTAKDIHEKNTRKNPDDYKDEV